MNRTEASTPTKEVEHIDPFQKPHFTFLSKTKRSSLVDDRSPGPAAYNPVHKEEIV